MPLAPPRPRGQHALSGLLLLLVFLLVPSAAHAQEEAAPDTVVTGWQTGASGKFSATQAGFRNWTQGGVNSLALGIGLDGGARRVDGRWTQEHTLRLAFGLVQQDVEGDDEVRKTDDLIRFRSNLQYTGGNFFAVFKPTIAQEARTQFAYGFNFDAEDPVRVSQFLSPAFFSQTVGLTYDPAAWITTRLGIEAKETLVLEESFRSRFFGAGVDTSSAVRFEVGLGLITDVERELFPNVLYTSSLGLFAAINTAEQPDIIWENLIAMKVNDWLSVNFEYTALYDEDQTTELQMRQVLAVGVSFILL
ncbi:MAG: DUF3078 domain-containing protein [Bacteroidota bacterium]